MKTVNKAKRSTNTGYDYITYTYNGYRRLYSATNKMTGRSKKFYVNGVRTREQAFLKAMAYVNS
jgi:hypothetical protein